MLSHQQAARAGDRYRSHHSCRLTGYSKGTSTAPPAPCIVYGACEASVIRLFDRSIGFDYLGIFSHGGYIDIAQFRETKRRQLPHGRHADAPTTGSGQETGKIATVRQAAIYRNRITDGNDRLRRFDQPNRQQGNALKQGAHHVTPPGRVVHADEKRHGLSIPIWRSKARKCRHEHQSTTNGR